MALALALLELEDPPEVAAEPPGTVGVPLVGPAVATAPWPPVAAPVSDTCGRKSLAPVQPKSWVQYHIPEMRLLQGLSLPRRTQRYYRFHWRGR